MIRASGEWKNIDGTRLWLYANGECWGYVPDKDKPIKNGTFWNYDAFQAWLKDRGYECVQAPDKGFEIDPTIRTDTAPYTHTPEGITEHAIRVLLLADAIMDKAPVEGRKELDNIARQQTKLRRHRENTPMRDDHTVINGERVSKRGVQCIDLFKKLGKDLTYRAAREALAAKDIPRISDTTFGKYMRIAFGKGWKPLSYREGRKEHKPAGKHPWREYTQALKKDPATTKGLYEDVKQGPPHVVAEAISLIVSVNELAARCGGRTELRKILDQLDELSGVITRG